MRTLSSCIVALSLLLAPMAASARDEAPTGYSLAYASFAPLDRHVYVARADGDAARALTDDAETAYDASFSRDGRWIVFTSERAGSADVYRMHPDGSGREALVVDPSFDDQATLSPDGASLAFVSTRSGSAHVWIEDLSTRKLHDVTPGGDGNFRPAWSPDGRTIAFTSDRDSTKPKYHFVTVLSTEVYTVRADGTGSKRITHANAMVGSPSWSADGRRIVAYAATVDDVRIVTGPQRVHGTSQVVTVDVATGDVRTETMGRAKSGRRNILAASVSRTLAADRVAGSR